jgi:glycosyltransferase involved in cell wall biosynthesis
LLGAKAEARSVKVLMMADVPPDPDSGAAGTEWQTAKALERAGVKVQTVWAGDMKRYVGHGNLHYFLELPLTYRAVLRAHVQKRSYDVVHVNQPHGYLAARELRASDPHAVFVHRSHGFEGRVEEDLSHWKALAKTSRRSAALAVAQSLMGRALTLNNHLIARYAHGHIVSASQCASFLAQRHRVAPERIAVVKQAAPSAFHEPLATDVSASRRNKLLYVGQFAFVKAPFFVARIAQQVLKQRPQTTFTWVCDERSHSAARDLFKDPSVLSRVSFLPWQPQIQLRGLYDAHGIFLFPSLFEGFGKAFIEAMTRGLCVVAADNGGMHDVITSRVNGILERTGDCDSMAEACLALIDDASVFLQMSAAARSNALNYTWDKVGTETVEFYERLLRLNTCVHSVAN